MKCVVHELNNQHGYEKIHKVNVHGFEYDGLLKKEEKKQETKISTGCEWLKRDNGMLKKNLSPC